MDCAHCLEPILLTDFDIIADTGVYHYECYVYVFLLPNWAYDGSPISPRDAARTAVTVFTTQGVLA